MGAFEQRFSQEVTPYLTNYNNTVDREACSGHHILGFRYYEEDKIKTKAKNLMESIYLVIKYVKNRENYYHEVCFKE